ncbi:coiled-coil domain-containing protein 115 isoform X1 [Senna tora]|uniref:Vacuolar ATPase assembly protein VMA22 n=1 Tax=Senna tora TaxID=362788 RepID=A0A835CJJ3_9FABA|nr:coiled-coil domain-containing protein 115 isoform X1 [Senna tora]
MEEDQITKETPKQLDEEEQQLQQRGLPLHPGAEEKLALQFLDSMHSYLTLFDALSSTLRQVFYKQRFTHFNPIRGSINCSSDSSLLVPGEGWLDLASARHSMGGSRINSSLLDLKFHSAATSVKITQSDDDSIGKQPCFVLRKWVSSEHGDSQLEDDNGQLKENSSVHQSSAEEAAEVSVAKNLSGSPDNDQVQKERSKSLSVFGVLIPPKLRASQLSFERALETLVEIANMQSSLLSSFHQLHQEVEDN